MDRVPVASSSPKRVVSSDGTPIAVWRSGAGRPLLLVHGTTADHTRWARISPMLESSFTVYAMDRRGRGGSGDAAEYSIEHEGEDVAAVVDWVGEPVNMLGHSYGAICCIEGALRTRNVEKLVLYEPPIPVGPEIVPEETRTKLDALIARNYREEVLLTFFREVVRVPETQLDIMRAHPAWPGRVAAAHTVSREVRIEADYRLDFARLRAIETPALLLLGGESPALFHEATRRLHDALPNSRIHEMPGQQHVAMDLIPDQFVEILRAFVLS
jgi:pimeloyl-ACP methyl ester carboxylesterase